MTDSDYMKVALQEAQIAAREDEVPVGAVLVHDNRIIAQNHNRMVQMKNPLAHAELLTMQSGLESHPVRWLLDTTLYVTLEPCAMCAGAIVLSRIKRLVVATPDPKAGACGSVFNLVQNEQLNHRVELEFGPLQQESSVILKDFFQKRRKPLS